MITFINKIRSTLLQVVVLIAVLIGVPYVYGWSSPTGAPPSNNTPAPINVNAGYQIKSGDIGASTLYANAVNANSFLMPTSAGAGKVLTSDGSGNASWQVPTAGLSQNTWINSTYYGSNGDIYLGFWSKWLSTDLSERATHRGEGTNFIDYARYVYNNGAYSGSGWTEPSDLGVRYAASAGSAGYANSAGSAPSPQGTLCGVEFFDGRFGGSTFTTYGTCQGYRPYQDGCPSGYSQTWMGYQHDTMTCIKQ